MTFQTITSSAQVTPANEALQADFANLTAMSVTGHLHNLALPPNDTAGYEFENNNATHNITGLQAPTDNHRVVMLFNHSSTHMHILHNNGGSSAGNRILCPNQQDFWLDPRAAVYAQYSANDGYWFLVSQIKGP